jgi:Ca2+/Na+ antiporter
VGLTFTAAGTSLPNLFASLIVAKQGLGNMSVSNAFGSNTFNIFIALALPWFIGSMRLGLQDDGKNECKAFSQIGSCYTYHVRFLRRAKPTIR